MQRRTFLRGIIGFPLTLLFWQPAGHVEERTYVIESVAVYQTRYGWKMSGYAYWQNDKSQKKYFSVKVDGPQEEHLVRGTYKIEEASRERINLKWRK